MQVTEFGRLGYNPKKITIKGYRPNCLYPFMRTYQTMEFWPSITEAAQTLHPESCIMNHQKNTTGLLPHKQAGGVSSERRLAYYLPDFHGDKPVRRNFDG